MSRLLGPVICSYVALLAAASIGCGGRDQLFGPGNPAAHLTTVLRGDRLQCGTEPLCPRVPIRLFLDGSASAAMRGSRR